MEMGSSRFGEDSALDPHPELSEHHQQQFLFPGTGPGPFPWAFGPVQGEVRRKAQQQPGSSTGAQVLGQVWIWSGPKQSEGVGIA